MIPNTLEITNDFEWNQSVIKSEKPVLVSFYAEWCASSLQLNSVLCEAAKLNGGLWNLAMVNVDVDDVRDIAQDYAKSRIPAVVLINSGKKSTSLRGFSQAKALRFLKDVNDQFIDTNTTVS